MNTAKKLRSAFLAVLVAMGFAPAVSSAGPVLQQISPNPAVYLEGTDYVLFRAGITTFASFPGSTTAFLQLVPPDLGTGCEAADFNGFNPGNIALIRRGFCLFSDKVNLAEDAGAVGVLIYNNLPDGFGASVTLADPTSIPSMFITGVLGAALIDELARAPVTIHMSTLPSAVPEPATLALLALGLAGLGFSRRKKV